MLLEQPQIRCPCGSVCQTSKGTAGERLVGGGGRSCFPPGGGDISPSSNSVHSASWDRYPQPLCRLGQKRRLLLSLLYKPLNIPAVPSSKQVLPLATSLRFQKGHPCPAYLISQQPPPWSPWRAQPPTQVRGSSQPPSSKSNPPEAPHRGEKKIRTSWRDLGCIQPFRPHFPPLPSLGHSVICSHPRACALAVLSAWNVLPGILRNGSLLLITRASAPMLPPQRCPP